MQALNSELEPVLERVTDELKAVVNKHGVSFIGKAKKTERLALKTLLESTEGASGSFEA